MNDGSIAKIEREGLTSRTFSALKWILPILVVCDHYYRIFMLPGHLSKDPVATRTAVDLVYSFILNFEVPVFFLISGYLICTQSHVTFSSYRYKLKRRLVSLGIPYIVFIAYGFFIEYIQYRLHGSYPHYNAQAVLEYFTGVPDVFPINVPLWFMRDLIILCLIYPLVHVLLKTTRGLALILISVPYLLFFKTDSYAHLLVGPVFFSLGYYLRMIQADPVVISRRIYRPLIPLYIILGIIVAFPGLSGLPADKLTVIKNINSLIFIPVIIALVSIAVENKRLPVSARLVSAMFFIYVTHHPLRNIYIYYYYHHFRDIGDVAFVLSLTCLTAATIFALWGVYLLSERLFPRLTGFVMGHRDCPPKMQKRPVASERLSEAV